MKSIFLWLDHFPSGSRHLGRDDWIELLDVRWAMRSQPGLEGSPPAPDFDDLVVVKRPDRASPALAAAGAGGRQFRGATIEFVETVGQQSVVAYRIELEDVMVTRVALDAVAPADREVEAGLWQETVSLSFDEIRWQHREVDESGTPKSLARTGWSRRRRQSI